jgi:glutamyl-tRNA reductase
MHYLLVSLSHKNTDLTVREKLSFTDTQKRELLSTVLTCESINEAVIVTTCNRMEITVSVNNCSQALDRIYHTLSVMSGIDESELQGRADSFEDEGAVRHLFSVASALESIVIGESQIIGQLKESCAFAKENESCGKKLGRLFKYAFKCAAAVKSSTLIGQNPVSVASAAVAGAKEKLGNLGGYTAVVVGYGEMSALAARHLIKADANVIIIGRNFEKAEALSEELGDKASCEPFSKLASLLNGHRLLFSATAATRPIITQDMIEPKEFERYWFDLAVPRDIDEVNCENITLSIVDDLKNVITRNMCEREQEAGKAYKIVGEYTKEYFAWLQTLSVDPIIKELRTYAEDAYIAEVEKAIRKGYLPQEQRKVVITFLDHLFKNFLHTPITKLKHIADKPEADEIIEAVKYLFDMQNERLQLVPQNETQKTIKITEMKEEA